MEDRVLSHHGTKGMRWGIRRYQNKDGTLTPAGKKRYDKEVAKAKEGIRVQKNKARTQAKLDKLEALKKQARGETDDDVAETKVKAKSDTAPKKKTAQNMTDEELATAIRRAQMEDQYRALRPEQVSKGKQILSTVMNEVVSPALVSAGRTQLTNLLNKVGNDALKEPADPNSVESLRKQVEKLKLKNEIKDLKNPKPKSDLPEVKTWKDVLDKQKYDNTIEDRAKSAAKAKRKEEEEAAAKAKAEAQKQVDEYNKKWANGVSSDTVTGGNYSKRGDVIDDAKTVVGSPKATNQDTVDSGKKAIAGLLSGPVSSVTSNEVGFVDTGRQVTYEVLDKYGNNLAEFYD